MHSLQKARGHVEFAHMKRSAEKSMSYVIPGWAYSPSATMAGLPRTTSGPPLAQSVQISSVVSPGR
eukprot:scaffold1323_cov255-Pinguiococcus_pyrenoidosus.AAC.5